jgi:hypothetical protein
MDRIILTVSVLFERSTRSVLSGREFLFNH